MIIMSMTDKRIEDAKNGDQAAMSSLLMEYKGIVASVVNRMVFDNDYHRDIIQNVFFKVVSRIGGFSNKCRFSTWIYRIAVNESIEFLRKRGYFEKFKSEFNGFDLSGMNPDYNDGLDLLSKKEILDWMIVKLDSGTTAVVDSGAVLADIEITDKVVSMLVVKGSVSFSVSKKRSRKFIVHAGIADIIVTGTRFRVVRMDDVLSVAVNEGSVNAVYNDGTSLLPLSTGQAALVYGDTISVITNNWYPQLNERKLLSKIIGSDEDELTESRITSRIIADSLLYNLFTPGVLHLRKFELIENFSTILQSQGRYRDALSIMEYFSRDKDESGNGLNALKMKSELFLKNGDTADAVRCLEVLQKKYGDSTQKCSVLLKLYKISMKKRTLQRAENCFRRYVECNPGKKSIDKEVIDHAHAMRNGSLFDEAIYWYEYILDKFPESSIHSDAQYWVSDCIIKKRISKTNAFKDKVSSGW